MLRVRKQVLGFRVAGGGVVVKLGVLVVGFKLGGMSSQLRGMVLKINMLCSCLSMIAHADEAYEFLDGLALLGTKKAKAAKLLHLKLGSPIRQDEARHANRCNLWRFPRQACLVVHARQRTFQSIYCHGAPIAGTPRGSLQGKIPRVPGICYSSSCPSPQQMPTLTYQTLLFCRFLLQALIWNL